MDRPRKPGSKSHPPFVMEGLIPLGKTKGPTTTPTAVVPDPETTTKAPKTSTSAPSSKGSTKGSSGSSSSSHGKGSGSDRKREGDNLPASTVPSKKSKTQGHSSSSSSASLSAGSSPSASASSSSLLKTEQKLLKKDVEYFLKQLETMDLTGAKFLQFMEKAEELDDPSITESVLLGSLKRLRQMKEKPDITFCQALLLSAKDKAVHLQSPAAVDAMCSLAKTKRPGVDIKNRPGQYYPIMSASLAVNMILSALADVAAWPLNVVQIWLEDACHERYWVDRPECQDFIDMLINSFETLTPESDLLPPPDHGPGASGNSSPALITDLEPGFQDELAEIIQEHKVEVDENVPRFSGSVKAVESMIVEYAKEIIQKRSPELPKNLFRMLGSSCGLQEVRSFVISRIEQWLHNPKCSRYAQELLMYLCVNAKSYKSPGADGGQYIVQICKLRMKTKQLTHLFSVAMREMVRGDGLNLKNVLVQIVYNELSLQRNPTNYPVLGSILSAFPEARSELAVIFMDLLQKKEEFIVPLRQILRDSMRACRHDCNLSDFVFGLLNIRELTWPEGSEIRSRVFRNVVDLVVFSLFLSFTPTVKEASVSRTEKNVGVLTNFYNQIAKVQEEALSWLYSVAMKLYRPQKVDYQAALYKFILKDPVSDLNYKENWPTESDRNMFSRHCLEVPLLEPAFMWVLFQAFSKEHNFFQVAEILDATEMMVMKAALHGARIEISKSDLIDSLFRLTEYNPEKIALPIGYTPPKLGITKSYWRVWTMLLVLASYNPTVFGKKGWETLPTLKVLMEMCMTNHFTFPTLASTETLEEIVSRELQICAIEKEQILEFETHLAAASSKCTITEKNSILLAQLITLDPYGKPRTPQPWVTPHLKSLNEQLRLGYRFCRSRNPDFLVDLMGRKTESMPWLSELVTEGSFDILPVPSLCEFMMGQTDRLVKIHHNLESDGSDTGTGGGDKSPKKGHKSQTAELAKEDTKSLQLLQFLQNAVQKTSEENATEILEFFFRRLSYPKAQSRLQGIQALQLLFSSPKKPLDDNWLLETIPALPLFSDVRDTITKCLREAIQVENEPTWIARYLEFLSVWGVVDSDTILDNLALDVTQLVVERCIVIQALLTNNPEVYDSLFDIYLNYMKKIREPGKDCQQWTGSIEQVLVRWDKIGLEANMNILIVHAIVILLSSYAEISSENESIKKLKSSREKGPNAVTELRYNELLEMWFPKQTEYAPKGLLLNTVEEAVLFPDWIKLRMIRSNNTRLLAAASEDLDIDQLVLFVQSFGIPIQSMTGLLYCLDKAVEESPQKMSEAILDARYMKTIVEVQWKRGAQGGEKFFRLLNQLVAPEEEVIEKFVVTNPYNPRPVLVLPELSTSHLPGKKSLANFIPLGKKQQKLSEVKGKEEAMDTSGVEDLNIRSLTRQLLHLSSPSGRRRSSVPSLEETAGPSNQIQRRHSLTQEKKPEGSPYGGRVQKGNTVGQLVDKIREVEPCIVKNALDVQLALLFGRSEITPHCRAFLLTVLTHESGWQTVEECLNLFLGEFVPSYDPSAVLDLIRSTISNPKLWQGVDKYVPKHQKQLSVFTLTNDQLLVMAEYIVEEISQLEMKNTKFSISNLLGPSEVSGGKDGRKTKKHCLSERVSLWLLCCHHEREVVDAVMNTLSQRKSRNPCTKKFLSQIYMEFPQVILTENWKEKPEDLMSGTEENGNCVLDTVTHILINAVANVQPGKEWAKKVTHEFELCLRKIASVHPTLLLRQLPLMCVLLEGRVHLEFKVFHSQNHHIPFKVFLGLFDLMQPHILKQFKTLKPILTLYMQLFQSFGHMKDYGTSVSRCSVLLHNLLSTNPLEMKEFLGNNYSILKDLSNETYYLEVGPLQNLITSVVPPSSNSELSILTQNRKEMDPFSMSSKQSNGIHDRLENSNNNDEILSALSELESLAVQNPAVLHQFSDYLNSYLHSDLESCRQVSFNLILRHMTYSPGASKLYLKSILQALKSQVGSRTIETLVDRIPEFVVLAQDNADVILIQMFELGLSSSMSMLPTLIKSLALLRSQIGT